MPGVSGMHPISVEGAYYTERYLISGSYIYEAKAPVGSAEADPVWQVGRYDTTGPIVHLWADGDSNFDNSADDMASLSYA